MLFRFFSFLNYCDVYRNANEEMNQYEKRPTYAALAVWAIKIVHAYNRILFDRIARIPLAQHAATAFRNNIYNNKDFVFAEPAVDFRL